MRRSTWYVRDFGSDYDDEDGPARTLVAPDDPRANCIGSRCADVNEGGGQVLLNWHMPVIDVDHPIDKDWEKLKAVEDLFLDVRWVRSTNNWHAYSDTPIRWEDFVRRMKLLVEHGVVEEGYFNSMCSRGVACVRMPHIKKGSAGK